MLDSIDPHLIWEGYWDQKNALKQNVFRAVVQGKPSELRAILIEQIINLNDYVFLDGWTLLHHAVNLPNAEVVKILLDNQCKPNAQTSSMKHTPLHLSVLKKNSSITELLLKMGANPNIFNADYVTPMHYIVEFGYIELLEIFLKKPDVNFLAENNRRMNTLDCCRCHNMKKRIK